MPSTKRTSRVEPNGSHDVNQAAAGIPSAADLEDPTGAMRNLLHALQAMRVGDFSVRLPRDQIGLAGKIADTFNDIVAANERMAQQLEQVGQVVGREGKTRKRVKFGLPTGAWGEMEDLGQHADRRPAVADHRGDPRDPAVAQGDLLQTVRLDVDGRPLQGRVPALGHHRQHDDQAAQRVHLGGDARGARGRHRRQARRPGAGRAR